MPDEPEVCEIPFTEAVPPSDLGLRSHTPSASTYPAPEAVICEIVIDRDLAVQLVGSDAGKARRMRPHGAMTKGSSDEELADVRSVMEPFLNDEIRRVHEDKTHCPKVHVARATPRQAASLKAFSLRFAASLEMNLEKHPGDDNRHRSQQRLDQSRRVIAQVNAALGISHDDGRTLERAQKELVARLAGISAEIVTLRERATAVGKLESIRPLLHVQDVLVRLAEPAAAP
jgi:hypothetical protein